MKKTDIYRESVLLKIAGGKAFRKSGTVSYIIDGYTYHIKVKTGQLKRYPFNINKSVLSADYEVYVCGTDELYYVIPVELIRKMHSDPSAMPDYTYPGYTVVDVCPDEEKIIYGTGGKSLNVGAFRNVTL